MSKDDLIYVGHMLDMGRSGIWRVQSRSKEDYDGDENPRLALTHLVQTIGEAARCVSTKFRNSHPQIPWSRIVGIRHKVVHD